MSFIAGSIDFNKDMTSSDIIKKMSKAINYGSKTAYTDSCAALLATDIATKNCYTAIFSGQIYNLDEIIKKLSAKNYNFENKSIAEIVLLAYIEWGKDCLAYFNGIFALAIWQAHSKNLFLARDRVGAMPLYYYRHNSGIVFSSDIKILLESGGIKREIDNYGLKQLLLLGPSKSIDTGIIKGVKSLKMANYLIFENNCLKEYSYWQIKAFKHTDDLAKTVEKTRYLIDNAIISQLKDCSCCMLSGGLDSSIISMVAARHYKGSKTLYTYSVDFLDNEKHFVKNSYQPSRDNIYIDLMQKFINSRHKYIFLDNLELAKSITEAAYARRFPGMGDIDSSLLLFLQQIKKEHDICLSGECADELFGGYPWYQRDELLYKDTFPWSDATGLRVKLFKGANLENDANEFVNAEYKKIINYTDYLDDDDKKDRRIREMFMLNFYHFMQTLLERSMSMGKGCGMEVRTPFCDYRIVEYAFNMPWKYKALGGREKGIVREAYKDLLPKDIVFRKKNPYPKTFSPIFSEYVITKAKQLIADKNSILNLLVDKEFFEDLTYGRVKLDRPWYGQLMQVPQIFAYLIQLDAFFRNFNLQLV